MFSPVIEKQKLKCIGNGRYTSAYDAGNHILLGTLRCDYTKELYCQLSGSSIHLPVIEFLTFDPETKLNWYVTDRSYAVSRSGEQYQLMSRIQSVMGMCYTPGDAINRIDQAPFPMSIKVALHSLVESHMAIVSDDICFDTQLGSNFAIDSSGNLILRDILSPVL